MEQKVIFFDQHDQTSPCLSALQVFQQMASERKKEEELQSFAQARSSVIYDLVGASPQDQFVFTPSGAQAIHQVHWSAFIHQARKEGKTHFVTTPLEDFATLQSLKNLEELGCFVKIAPLDAQGRVDVTKLSELLGPRTALVSLSVASGLTGVIQPIEEIATLAKAKNVWLHVDMSYAVGKMEGFFSRLSIDYLTFAGHLVHSVPGSGGVMAKQGRPLASEFFFDAPSFFALASACQQASLCMDAMNLEVARLRDRFEKLVQQKVPQAKPLFQDLLRLPNVSVITFSRVHQEALLYKLKKKGVIASIGGNYSPHLHRHLIATGFSENAALTAMSFSFSRFTTQEEIDLAVEMISTCVESLLPLTEDLFA